jgi:N-acetylglucosamine PTS system EIICBA or EIICB component
MFLAPALYAVHAVLTGTAMVIMHALNVHLGFGFSAGLFDYVLNFSLSTNPWLLIPVGAGYFALYFVLFRWFILRFDLKTLGREADDTGASADVGQGGETSLAWIRALGGATNLRAVEACTTRLRLTVSDPAQVNEAALKPLGSRGVLKLGDGAVQVVVGPIADQLAAEIRSTLRHAAAPAPDAVPANVPAPAAVHAPASSSPNRGDLAALLTALGGRKNLARAEVYSSRVAIEVIDGAVVDEARLRSSGYRSAARISDKTWHLIVGPEAAAVAFNLKSS